ncbi:DUF1467 family protein [Pelagibius sp. Alg239-R121]|uniref:DUF1467 family protein n=1 Tax=Pelagibius sp. Alg239-R121 TaxID=2993448 RepID=UPI0024A72EFB|nr:DUF1467 family protein [Pelagibius sp. Alg239-R121]
MNWFTGILVYVIVWWVVLFMVLPWGVRREENPEEGHEAGAPVNPMLGRKVLITSGIAAVIWGAVYVAIEKGLLPFSVK